MGGHANYYKIIEDLVILKNEYHRVKNVKFQSLLKELSRYEVYPHSDNEHLPNHKQLADKMGMTQTKMNSILKGVLIELIQDFRDVPLSIKNVTHQFFIYIPWDERQDIKNKEYLDEISKQSSFIQIELPFIPRLGEEIEIPFIQETGKFYRGYVHEIHHKITGTTQEILIYLHPWNNYYNRWTKMADDYERDKRWRERMRAESNVKI